MGYRLTAPTVGVDLPFLDTERYPQLLAAPKMKRSRGEALTVRPHILLSGELLEHEPPWSLEHHITLERSYALELRGKDIASSSVEGRP